MGVNIVFIDLPRNHNRATHKSLACRRVNKDHKMHK
jgi:hypothetical protein